MSIPLAILVLLVMMLAHWLARRVTDEMTYLEKPLRVLQAISGLTLLFVLPWWLALLLTGALAVGGFAMAVAIGVLAALAGTSTTIAAIALPLAMFAGGRIERDTRALYPLLGTAIGAAIILLTLQAFGVV